MSMEHFTVKHYGDTAHPCIKGNGFDGLTVGDYRDEAENFIVFINKIIDKANTHPESTSPAPEIVAVKKSCKNCNHFGGCEKLCMEDRKMWEPKNGAIAIYHEAVKLPTPPEKGE